MADELTPTPTPTDPGAPPGVGGTAPSPSSSPSPSPSTSPAPVPSAGQTAGGLFIPGFDASGVIGLLVAGRLAWSTLSPEQQRAVIEAIGLDPTGQYTPEQIEAAAKAFTEGGDSQSAGAPTPEPPTIDIPVEEEVDPWTNAIGSLYMSLWGEPPPENWLSKQLGSDKNLFEIELEERSKPAFMHTKTAEDEYADKAASLSSALGLR